MTTKKKNEKEEKWTRLKRERNKNTFNYSLNSRELSAFTPFQTKRRAFAENPIEVSQESFAEKCFAVKLLRLTSVFSGVSGHYIIAIECS